MNSSSPQIGFDRFIQLDWALLALRIRAGRSTLDDLDEVLGSSHSGPAAKKKTRTVLNRLWLEPRADLADFADRGVEIFCNTPETTVPALTWGRQASGVAPVHHVPALLITRSDIQTE